MVKVWVYPFSGSSSGTKVTKLQLRVSLVTFTSFVKFDFSFTTPSLDSENCIRRNTYSQQVEIFHLRVSR